MTIKLRGMMIDLRPLRESAPFRRIFAARVISLFAIGMLQVSVMVQMWDLTGSTLMVGAMTVVTGVTTFLGMIAGGVLADRIDRKRLILIGRSAASLAFAGLAANAFGAFGDGPQVWAVYVLGAIDGLIGALSASALMAALPTLLPRSQMVAVGALTSLSVNIGGAISPGIAGLLIAGFGVGWTYTVAAAISVITVLILLGLPSLSPQDEVLGAPKPHGGAEAEAQTAEGARPAGRVPSLPDFLRREPVVLAVMAVGLLTMLGYGVVSLLPALVDERFSGNSRATGLFFAVIAAGAAIAALTSGWMSRVRRPGRLLVVAVVLAFTGMVLFGLTPWIWLAAPLLLVFGYLDSIADVLRYSLIQHHTPGPLLGRVNGIWMAQEVSGVAIGAVVAGGFGAVWSASQAISYYGLLLLVLMGLSALMFLRPLLTVRGEAPESEVTLDAPAECA